MNILETRGTVPLSLILDDLIRVLTLQDYNTRIVLAGTLLLGATAGLVGTFMLLRKRALVGDVVSHASLPGIAIAFIVLEMNQPGSGKSLAGLTLGAVVAGSLGILATTAIRTYSRIRDDAALAIVLSIFFGLGIALFTTIQDMPTGNAAGLNHFIFGRAASMTASDVNLLALAATVSLVICLCLFKEFSLLCFDEEYAAAQGWPAGWLDIILMALVVTVTVIGQQSVGLLLVVAMLILPAVSARFWTHRIGVMATVSAVIGAVSSLVGGILSALFPRLAAGAIMVLVSGLFFAISLLTGRERGLIPTWIHGYRLRKRVDLDDLLRALYELIEAQKKQQPESRPEWCHCPVPVADIWTHRHWTRRRLQSSLGRARRNGWIEPLSDGDQICLSAAGVIEAVRAVRNHRLWELFLMHHADIAAAQVDRQADAVEHVLEAELVRELEELLRSDHAVVDVPPCPHSEDESA